MNLFNLMAKLSMDSAEYDRAMDKAGRSAGGLKDTIVKLGIGTAVAGIGKAAIDAGMDFEQGMAGVAGIMGITSDQIKSGSEDFEKLRKSAKEAGASTKFSATQAAEGLGYMALAGLNADEAVGLLPKVLDAAAASGMDLASASDLITDGMSAMGIELKDAGKFIDKITKTSQRSNTSFSQLGDALLTVGGTAKVLRGGVTEANTALGILADNSIKGSEGGTALRNIILSLSSPTDKAARLMEKLGLNIFDAQGEMRPMQDILNDLNGALGKMTSEERTQALSTMFNKVDLKSVNALLANSTDRWDELSAAIEDSEGATKQTAETMNNTLKGRLTEMGSALEGLGIAIYEKFQEPMKNAIQWITDKLGKLVDALNSGDLDGKINAIVGAMSGIVTYLAVMKGFKMITSIIDIGKNLFNVVKMIKSASGAMGLLNFVMAANPAGVVALAIGALVGAFVYLWNTSEGFRNFWVKAWESIKVAAEKTGEWLGKFFTETIPNFFKSVMDFLKNNWKDLLLFLVNPFVGGFKLLYKHSEKFKNFIDNFVDKTKQKFSDFTNSMKEFFTVKIPEAFNKFVDYVKSIPSRIYNGLVEAKNTVGQWLVDTKNLLVEKSAEMWQGFVDFVHSIPDKLREIGLQIGYNIGNFIKGIYNFFTVSIPAIYNSIVDWFKKLPGEISQWFTEVWQNAVNWGIEMWNSAYNTGKKFYDNIVNWFKELPGKIGEFFSNAWEKTSNWGIEMWNSAYNTGKKFYDNIINWFSQLPGRIKAWFTEVINKVVNWKNDMVKKAKETGSEFSKWLKDSLKNLPREMMDIGKNIVQGVWNGIKNAKDWFMNSVKGFFGGIVDGVKSSLGIHSPSRVFRDEVGQWIPAGVEVGIEREMPKLRNTLDEEFSNLTDLDMPNIELNAKQRQEDMMNKLRSMTIEIPIQVDGREFTRVAVAPFQDELQDYNETHNLRYSYN